MKKITPVIVLLLVITSLIHGQTGFMGKRHYLNTDAFNAIYQGKYNLAYQYCLSNNITVKATVSKFSKTYPDVTSNYDTYYDELLNSQFTIKSTDVSFNGYSWEAGINIGYYVFTGMPMPVGYYMGMSYEHISGSITEKCDVQKEFSSIISEKNFEYKSKAGIIKFQYGRNTYIKKNFILNTSVDLGLFIGKIINPDYDEYTKSPEYILPTSIPFCYRRESFDIDYFGQSTYIDIYIMPEIGIGYIF